MVRNEDLMWRLDLVGMLTTSCQKTIVKVIANKVSYHLLIIYLLPILCLSINNTYSSMQ